MDVETRIKIYELIFNTRKQKQRIEDAVKIFTGEKKPVTRTEFRIQRRLRGLPDSKSYSKNKIKYIKSTGEFV